MALTRSFPTQHASGLPITDTRRVTSGLIVRSSAGVPRPGILPAHANPIVTARASMGYDVAPFVAATSRVNTGVELVANDAVTTVATTAAPGANSRIDVIWVRAQFVQHGDTNNDVVFGVTQGTAAVTPVKPTLPAGAFELATATIPSTATTTQSSGVVITQTYTYTSTIGSPVWLRNQVEQDAWSPADGYSALRLDTGETIDRVGGAWAARRKPAGGVFSGSTNTLGIVNVTHGLGKIPLGVTVSMATDSPVIPKRLKGLIGAVNSTFFEVLVLRSDASDDPLTSNPVKLYWTAVA